MNDSPSLKQQEATDILSSVWVDASAGTGKTKVLTDRVLRLLLSGCAPSRILCLTFTKAAAAEMQNRVKDKLLSWSVYDEVTLKDSLLELLGIRPSAEQINNARLLFFQVLDDPYGLQILTIHGFCQRVLSRFTFEAKVPLNFNLSSDIQQKELFNLAIEKFFIQLSTNEELHSLLLACVSNGYQVHSVINNVKKMVLDPQFKHFVALCDVSKVELHLKTYFAIDDHDSADIIVQQYPLDISRMREMCGVLRNESVSAQKLADRMGNIITAVAFDLKQYTDYYSIFFTADDKPRKKVVASKVMDKYPWLADFIVTEQNKLEVTREKINSLKCLQLSYAFTLLAHHLLQVYTELKHQNSVLDFGDLIDKTKQLFSQQEMEWILFKLDDGVDHILVDESQDTSINQWELILKIVEDFFNGESAKCGRTLFVVGDRKQSIYSFQGAEPSLFVNLRYFFENKASSVEQKWKNISLDVSFRSSQAVLDLVNVIFADLFSNSYRMHKSFQPFNAGKVELWDLSQEKQATDNKDLKISATRVLAERIAKYISGQIRQGMVLKAKGRTVTAQDFMILVQRRSTLMYQIIRALKKYNVPVSGPDRVYLTSHIAIQDLIALVEFLLLPDNDYELCCVLKSPLFNLTDDDLLTLAPRRNDSIFAQLKHSDIPRHREIYQELIAVYKFSQSSSVYELFCHIFYCKDYRQRIIARMGDDVVDILDEFMNFTFNFNKEDNNNLQEFLITLKQSEIEIKRDLFTNGINAVKIMTVHGAKGLQSPIVILPDTTYIPKNSQLLMWVEDKEKNNLPIYNVNDKLAIPKVMNVQQEAYQAQLLEYYRLLYVALTRAEDHLIICGVEKNNYSDQGSWYQKCLVGISNIKESVADNDITCYETEQLQSVAPTLVAKKEQMASTADSNFIFTKMPAEPGEADPSSPSTIGGDIQEKDSTIGNFTIENMAAYNLQYEQGEYMHELLENLPKYPVQDWQRLIKSIANKYKHISHHDLAECNTQVVNLIQDKLYADIWGKCSSAEVPITGEVDRQKFNAIIDRLIVKESEVIIIDFKTNRTVPKLDNVPLQYLVQMKIYQQLVQQSFPTHNIITQIIWVRERIRMIIPLYMMDNVTIGATKLDVS